MTPTSRSFVEVKTLAGRVRGVWRGEPGATSSSAAFLGIPFAEPPVRELRFQAPVAHRAWNGVRDALEYGATAQRGDPGVTLIPDLTVPGESILNINVFTPAPEKGSGLPVLVWIHGGGYVAGSPASPWYDGARFNRDAIVTVSISYRLGFDGFGWIEGAPANRGVRDWLLALEWVQQNIGEFGGDATRVTIAGQSAGGGAVQTLLGMEAAQHLFQSAYSISGVLADVSPERAAALSRKIAVDLEVSPTLEGFSSVSEERLREAQQQSTKVSAASFATRIADGLSLGPMVDGELIRRPANESFAAGIGQDKPLVLGTADEELSMVLTGAAKKLRWVPKRLLLSKFGLPRRAMRQYLRANADAASGDTARIGGQLITDLVFRKPLVGTVSQRGAGATWVYRFSWRSQRSGFAEHCIDVPFFFDCLDSPVGMEALAGTNPPQALADDVHSGAVAFISGGDPGWLRYQEPSRKTRVFDTPSYVTSDGYAGVRPLL